MAEMFRECIWLWPTDNEWHAIGRIEDGDAKYIRVEPPTRSEMTGYMVVDRNNEPVAETIFPTERKAYEAKRVYEDNCDDIARPLRVVPAETAKKEAA